MSVALIAHLTKALIAARAGPTLEAALRNVQQKAPSGAGDTL